MKRITTAMIVALVYNIMAWGQTMQLTHDDCRAMAIAHSEDIKMAANHECQAQLDNKIALATRLPRVSVSGNGLYMAPEMDMSGMKLSMKGAYTAGIMLTQPIWVGGKITAGISLSEIGLTAAKEQGRAAEIDVIANADNAYWTYVAVREKKQMLMSLSEFIDATYAQVEAAVSVDMATRADLLRVEAKRSEIAYQLEKVNSGLEICRINLCQIIGTDLYMQIVPLDTAIVIANPTEILTTGVRLFDRPEYRLLQQQIDGARQQIKMVRADYLPTVALSAGYTWYGNMKLKGMASDGMGGYVPYTQGIDDHFGFVMLSVNVPLWSWGEGCRKVKKQELALDNAKLELEKNVKLMDLQVRNAHEQLSSAYTMVNTAEIGEKQAAEALRVQQDRYEVGFCTLTDLLEAQSQWHRARANTIEARTQYKITETEYLRAAGLLWQ